MQSPTQMFVSSHFAFQERRDCISSAKNVCVTKARVSVTSVFFPVNFLRYITTLHSVTSAFSLML